MEFVPRISTRPSKGTPENRLTALVQGIRLPKDRVSSVVTMGVSTTTSCRRPRRSAPISSCGIAPADDGDYLIGLQCRHDLRHARFSVAGCALG